MSVKINPKSLKGPWDGGYALDLHTLSSTFIGHDNFGHARYDTEYSEVGGLLYRLKSKSDQDAVPLLVDAIEQFWGMTSRLEIDLIVPVPPSKARKYQPVILVATALSERLNIPLCIECLSKVKQTGQLKDVLQYDKRMEALKNAFAADPVQTAGKNILLFDDLFRSGATVSTITTALKSEGQAKAVYLLTLTRTRSNA